MRAYGSRPRVRDIDDAAVWREVVANLRLVYRLARARARRIGPGVELDDLVQEGTLGLYRAVELFDPAAGFRLVVYAKRWIRYRIGLAVDGYRDPVLAPRRVVQRRVRSGRGADPRPMRRWSARRLDDVTVRDGPEYPPDVLPPEVAAALDHLPDRDRAVLRARFGLDGPAAMRRDLAAELGVSVASVKRIQARALAAVREELGVARAS